MKLVHGIGVNNADYTTDTKIDGERVLCPFFLKWRNMIERCYSSSFHDKNPAYKDCSVCDEWLTFSKFKCWMIKQDWQGKHLDKDILIQGNKVYSPETCIFVSVQINNIIHTNKSRRGKYPQGVSFDKNKGKFKVLCSVNGKSKHIGLYDNSEDASLAYCKFKSELIFNAAIQQKEPVRSALIRISNEYKNKTSN